METTRHSLKQFLVWLPGGGPDQFLIAAKAADQTVARHLRIERTRIDIGAGDVRRTPFLSGNVARFGRPNFRRHSLQLAVDEQKAFGHVSVIILRLLWAKASKIAQANTGLRPMRFRGG